MRRIKRRIKRSITRRKLSPLEREALWVAHRQTCFWCKRHLSLHDLEAEHVIPITLANKPDELAQLLSDLGWPSDFDLNDFENLLPAHRWCNNQKASRVLAWGPLSGYLLLARDSAPRVRQFIESKKNKDFEEIVLTDFRREMRRHKHPAKLADQFVTDLLENFCRFLAELEIKRWAIIKFYCSVNARLTLMGIDVY